MILFVCRPTQSEIFCHFLSYSVILYHLFSVVNSFVIFFFTFSILLFLNMIK